MKHRKTLTTVIVITLLSAWVIFFKINVETSKPVKQPSPNIDNINNETSYIISKHQDGLNTTTMDIRPKDIKKPSKISSISDISQYENHHYQYLKLNEDLLMRFSLFVGSLDVTDICDQQYIDQFVGYQNELKAYIAWYQNAKYIGEGTYPNRDRYQLMIDKYQLIEGFMNELINHLKDQNIVEIIESIKDINEQTTDIQFIWEVINHD